MRIVLLDERGTPDPDLAECLASALDADVMCFGDLAEARSSPGAADVDAVVVRCLPQTARPALGSEIRALWGDAPFVLVSARGADETCLAASQDAHAWIAEGQGCALRVAAALSRAVEQHLRSRQLEALNAIASEVNRSLDVIHVLDAALDQVMRAVRTQAAGIYLLEGDPPLLRLRAWRGLSDELVRAGDQLNVGEGFSGTIVASDQPLVVDDIQTDGRLTRPLVAQAGFHFFAGAPLRAGRRTTGTVFVVSGSRPTHLDLVPFLATVGNQVGTAIENARLYQEAEAARQQWEATFDAIEDPISIQDCDYTILRANRAFMHLMAHRGGPVIGARCYELVHGLGAPPEDCACQRLLRGEPPGAMQVQPPGVERQLVGSTYPLREPDGRLDGVVHIFRDVTEIRRLHERVAQTDKLAAVGELVAGVAHELNNPLSVVSGLTEFLLRQSEPLPPKVRDDLSAIAQEAARAARIVHNLLAFSRQTPMAMEPMDLHDCLRRSLELFDYQFRVDNIRVETDFQPDLTWVMGDRDRLQQVIVNLFSNARHALGQVSGGVLSVRTAAAGEMVRLEIADTGPGIPEEHLDRVFDPFFTTKEVGEGTGLGLSICHGIVAEHGGRIEITNRPAGGVLAAVELPGVPQPAQVPPPREPGRAPSPSDARVLVVDDEPLVRHFILRALETAGHGAAAAGNAEEALDLVRREAFDVVICDLKMPGAGGQGIYQTLVNEQADLAGRIVFCTGDTARPSTHAFLNGLGARCLFKPFTAQQLLDAVQRGREPQGEDRSP